MSFQHIFKIAVIGETNAGKTSLIDRYCQNTFSNNRDSTIGMDLSVKNLDLDNKNIRLYIWDISGHERYKNLFEDYCTKNHGIMITFDLTNNSSIKKVNQKISELQKKYPGLPLVLVGCKHDLVEVPVASILEYNIPFFMTSAKENKNVEVPFLSLTRSILRKMKTIPKFPSPSLSPSKNKNFPTALPPSARGSKRTRLCCWFS